MCARALIILGRKRGLACGPCSGVIVAVTKACQGLSLCSWRSRFQRATRVSKANSLWEPTGFRRQVQDRCGEGGSLWWALLREEEHSCLCPGSLVSQRPLEHSECWGPGAFQTFQSLFVCLFSSNSAFVPAPPAPWCISLTNNHQETVKARGICATSLRFLFS